MAIERMVIALLLGAFAASAAQAANRVEWEYWDKEKTKPKNIQVFDPQGRQTGEWIIWFPNGMMKSKTSFLHGSVLLFEAWYDDGQKRMQEPCADGFAHGLWIWWAPDGSVLARSFFHMGTGVEYYFDDAGKEKRKVFWISGVRTNEQDTAKTKGNIP
jgi:antitoxin component YwqK of YwqJK toxin-antitoxin module